MQPLYNSHIVKIELVWRQSLDRANALQMRAIIIGATEEISSGCAQYICWVQSTPPTHLPWTPPLWSFSMLKDMLKAVWHLTTLTLAVSTVDCQYHGDEPGQPHHSTSLVVLCIHHYRINMICGVLLISSRCCQHFLTLFSITRLSIRRRAAG